MLKILKEKVVFNNKLIIQEGQISDDNNNTFARLYIKRQDASAVLILNTDLNKVILTKQFRYAIASKTEEPILEIVAGKIDEGEEPLTAAIREAEEETGYRIKPGNIQLLLSCFASPGYSSERFFIYYATVTSGDRVSKGGGLESENENIEVIEMDINEFKKQIKDRSIEDAKTYIAGLSL
jgi:nudix-type nucleoside diphosphatase (YffH/AdpP family)